MTFHSIRNRKSSAWTAAPIILRVIRDSSDAFPPLKSAATAATIVWDMSKRVKSNKEDCKRLACRATEIVGDIWRQTECYGVELPLEVQQSVGEIEKIVQSIVALMREFEKQNLVQRYSRQDENKGRVEEHTKHLDEAIQRFDVNLQMSVLRLHMETSLCMKCTFLELDGVSRERHDQVLTVSRLSGTEREQLLTEIRG